MEDVDCTVRVPVSDVDTIDCVMRYGTSRHVEREPRMSVGRRKNTSKSIFHHLSVRKYHEFALAIRTTFMYAIRANVDKPDKSGGIERYAVWFYKLVTSSPIGFQVSAIRIESNDGCISAIETPNISPRIDRNCTCFMQSHSWRNLEKVT